MGPNTSYRLMVGTNPFNRQARADQSDNRPWNHGSWSGAEWSEEIVVPLRILIEEADTAAWVAAHQALAMAFRPIGEQIEDVELRFVIGAAEYVMFGRPRMVEPDLELIGSGKSFTQAAFVAQDPFIYGGTEIVTGPIGLPSFTGGLTVPLTVPFAVDGTLVGGFEQIVNSGTADTPLLLRIDGPVPQPMVAVLYEDGRVDRLRFSLELLSGQWLDVDTGARTVLLNGQAPQRGHVTGDFPVLPPGTHEMHFRAAEDTTGTVTARHRSAYW